MSYQPKKRTPWDDQLWNDQLMNDPLINDPVVNAISLWQPWASLMLVVDEERRKMFETRSYNTHVRGLVLIHATAAMPKEALSLSRTEPFKSLLLKHDPYWSMKRGQVLGGINLTDCFQIRPFGETPAKLLAGRPFENSFGDFSPGRYAWEAKNAIAFKIPFPWKGHQKWFDVPARSVLLATEQWDECPEWWGEVSGCPGCLCAACRSYG